MTLREFLADARKAVAVATTMESAAVAVGLLTSAQEGYLTAGLGAVAAAVTYFSKNMPPVRRN